MILGDDRVAYAYTYTGAHFLYGEVFFLPPFTVLIITLCPAYGAEDADGTIASVADARDYERHCLLAGSMKFPGQTPR